jgi:hypothetical protein
MHEVHVRWHYRASAEKVFNQLSDHVAFLGTSQIQCRLLSPGKENANGLGAVREVRSGLLVFEEEIGLFEAPRAYEYRIRSLRGPLGWKIPFQHQHGHIELESKNGGTEVNWTSRFHFSIPLIGHWLDRKIGKQIETTFLFFLKRLDKRLSEV